MYHLELADIMFYINSCKNTLRYNILDYVTPTTGYTRSSDNNRLNDTYSRTNTFYYNRLPRLWNSLPTIDMNLTSSTIKATLKNLFFFSNFDSDIPCTFHFKCPCVTFTSNCLLYNYVTCFYTGLPSAFLGQCYIHHLFCPVLKNHIDDMVNIDLLITSTPFHNIDFDTQMAKH